MASLKSCGKLRSQIIYNCTLPFPPSVNALFGGGSAQKRFPSKKYKDWRASCPKLDHIGIRTPCLVRYVFWLPDNRKRDLSNYLKAPEDYLVSQCVLVDDNHEIVAAVLLEFGGIDKARSRVEIEITSCTATKGVGVPPSKIGVPISKLHSRKTPLYRPHESAILLSAAGTDHALSPVLRKSGGRSHNLPKGE